MLRRALLALAAVGLLALGSTSAQAAPAAEKYISYIDGYRCEINQVYPLGKAVCRNPYQFSDYYVAYFDFDDAKGVVFVDSFAPIGQGTFNIRQENMTYRQWLLLYGPR